MERWKKRSKRIVHMDDFISMMQNSDRSDEAPTGSSSSSTDGESEEPAQPAASYNDPWGCPNGRDHVLVPRRQAFYTPGPPGSVLPEPKKQNNTVSPLILWLNMFSTILIAS